MAGQAHSGALALWCFVYPEALDAVDEWLKKMQKWPLGLREDAVLPPARLQTMAAWVVRKYPSLKGRVQLIEQHAGQMITVPPGVVHCVVNLQPCVKIAWDYIVPDHLPLYLRCWSELARRTTRHDRVFISVARIVLRLVCKLENGTV